MISLLIRAIRLFTTFLFGSTGEIITEKTGHLNLGTPGIMCVGGVGGCWGISLYLKMVGDPYSANGFLVVFFGIFFAMLFAGLIGAFYSFLTVSLRANQNITGLIITTFGVGFANFLSNRSSFAKYDLPNVASSFNNLLHLSENASDGVRLFFGYGILVYLAIGLAIVATVVMKKTRVGLNLRAVGESPATADAAGVTVRGYRYFGTIVGAAIAGLGGLSFIMDFSAGMYDNATSIEALGWLAVALVIFSVWKPSISIGGSLIFAVLYVLPNFIAAANNTKEIVKMAPYLATIVVLILTSIFGGKLVQPPASLGINYFREDR